MAGRTTASRRQAAKAGRSAEMLAVWLLRAKGYRILARGWRSPAGEIDILARRGRTVVAVEVKRRAASDQAAQAIDSRQRRRIARAAGAYLLRLPAAAELNLRFDAVLVAPGRWPQHIMDAWRP